MANKRLSKVARELNVGISTIVEFLDSKGIEVDGKPNTKIDPKVYDILHEEFQSEKSAKEESKNISMPTTDRETVSIETTLGAVEEDSKEQEDFLEEKIEAVEEEPVVKAQEVEVKEEKIQEDEEVVKEKVEETKEEEKATKGAAPLIKKVEEDKFDGSGPRVVGRIDLDAIDSRTRPRRKTKEEKQLEKQEKKEAEVAAALEKKGKEEKAKQEAKEKAEAEEKRLAAEREPKRHITDVEKLEGVTVLGKIKLPEKKEKKPVASSSDQKETQKPKRKRRRIHDKPSGSRKKGSKKDKKEELELSDKEIQEQIKNTLARLTGGSGKKTKGAKYRRQKREAASEQAQREAEEAEAQQSVLEVTEFVTANELASLMDVDVNEVISACMSLGLFVSINQRLDAETLIIVAEEFGFELEFIKPEAQEIIEEEEDDPADLVERYPIVTVMGHVDHGKTSLLDSIRKANVIAGEAGGITQHIGAYNVELSNKKKITFLDTPGHEAFTAMRARGAQVTDVAIVVIATDDNVMPQTKEAINHAQAAGVPIVFALNKVDKPTANPDKIREELSQMNILVEEWGGKYQAQEVSAKKGIGIGELLEKVLLEAELQELKANPKRNARGVVIEASLDKGRGYVTTVLVRNGTLKVGDIILAGPFSGRVKAMHNERGKEINVAGPSIPVSILGLSGAPSAGDKFIVMDDEREARSIATNRLQLQREQGARTRKHITLDEIGRRIAIGDFQELNIIVKGDMDGSIEALSDSLLKLSTEQIQVNIIHKSVGQITESDVMLAAASDALIIGFQVRPSVNARKIAEQEEIDIRLYSVIYDAIDELKSAMEGMLKPKVEEKVTASIEIRETFRISKVGTIAGCMVLDGKVSRNNKVRLIRDGIVVYTGELGSLKRFKDDVKEVAKGYECGLNIANYNDIKVGDIIESFEEVEVKQTL